MREAQFRWAHPVNTKPKPVNTSDAPRAKGESRATETKAQPSGSPIKVGRKRDRHPPGYMRDYMAKRRQRAKP
jgi:hypothetical protein